MKIAIGNDHTATEMKRYIVAYLEGKGYELVNFGTDGDGRVDYPVYGKAVAKAVASGECDLGILICGTGIGISCHAAGQKPADGGIRCQTVGCAGGIVESAGARRLPLCDHEGCGLLRGISRKRYEDLVR